MLTNTLKLSNIYMNKPFTCTNICCQQPCLSSLKGRMPTKRRGSLKINLSSLVSTNIIRYIYNILIPFSTIKSSSDAFLRHGDAVFQFHLVRLKEVKCHIKQFVGIFQFHLVRLKVICSRDMEGVLWLFQFHLVRLKVLLVWLLTRILLISIPFSTIKSPPSNARILLRVDFNSI